MKIGFIGLGIMGAPMALHLVNAGHQLFVHTRSKVPEAIAASTAHGLRRRAPRSRARPRWCSSWCPTRPTSRRCCSATNGVAAGLQAGGGARKIVVDMSSISPMATKALRAARSTSSAADYLDAPVSGGEVGAKAASLTIMCGGDRGGVRAGAAAVREDGQEHHAGRRQRRRPDHQGRQPDHRRAQHRRRRRGAAVRQQGRRRSGQGAPGADGRLRGQPHPRGAWRADDQAHLQSGLSHRACTRRTWAWRCRARASSAWRCRRPRAPRS